MRVLEKLENFLHLLQILLSVLQSERGVLAAPKHVHIGLSFINHFPYKVKVLKINYTVKSCWKIITEKLLQDSVYVKYINPDWFPCMC